MIVREEIHKWNAVHSKEKSMVLLPVGWESHTSPEMGARAQAIINRQTVDKCDLLVAIFGTRIGSETGKYPSGTVEEIEEHITLGKPAMLYFSNQMGNSDAFDHDQYAKLERLKKDYENRGLYDIYDSDSDLKDKFYRQLEIKVNEHKIFRFCNERINSDLERTESESNIPQLSDEAKVLLKGVSQDRRGYISYKVISHELVVIRFGEDGILSDKNLIPDQNRRVIAQWRAALKELKDAELLEDEGNRGEVFQITHRGYQVADMIQGTA